MNELEVRNDLKDLIYEVRGKQVMMDSDLAILYKCKSGTKEINQTVKNNLAKFPERFCFKLAKRELEDLKSQHKVLTVNNKSRSLPTVFTEQGIYMLATILKGEVATNVTIKIMDTFVLMRKFISSGLLENSFYKDMVISHDYRIKILEEKFESRNTHLFYEGQIYDAYSLMVDIFNTSKIKIIIIDNYLDKTLLDIISKTDKEIIIITNKYNNEEVDKYKSQYDNIIIKIDNSFHDRFIIIDGEVLYHCGASFKDLGKKCFSITRIEDKEILQGLINKILF